VDAPIGRDPRNRLRMAVVDPDRNAGKPAQTLCELLQNAEQGCLVRCLLRTGRTHQIRVHLASLGHPLVGDALYGGLPAAGMARQALHARRLASSIRRRAPPASGSRRCRPISPRCSIGCAPGSVDDRTAPRPAGRAHYRPAGTGARLAVPAGRRRVHDHARRRRQHRGC
jgi:hypothetical protein